MEPTEWLPQPSVATLQDLSSGAYHSNFLMTGTDQRLVLRVNLSSQWGLTARQQLAREFSALQDVSSSGRTPSPVALVVEEIPFIVETFVPGTPFTYRDASIKMAAAAFAACHAVVPRHSLGPVPVGDPMTDLVHGGFSWLDKVDGAERFRVTEGLLRRFGATIRKPIKQSANVIIHTDLIHANLLIGNSACAILDWEGARFGPAEWDLAYFISPVTTRWADGFQELTPSQSELLLREYSLAAECDLDSIRDRVNSFMPLVVFRALCWCLGYAASPDLSDAERYLVERFTDSRFVDDLLRRFHE